MSYNNNVGFIVAGISAGATVTTGAASAFVAIPTVQGNVTPRFIRVSATTESYVRLGTSSVVATTNDLLVQPSDCLMLAIPNGITHIAYIQGTATGKVNIAPMEMN